MLLSNLNLLATAPGGVARLRELILTLAVQGKLVPQDPADEPASVLLQKIRAEKDRLIAEGKIKKDKPLAAIAEEEKPFELPVGWEWVRIPEVTHSLGQGEPTEAFSYIDVASVDNLKGCVASEIQVLEATEAPSRARKNVALGTVIYSTIRPYLKNIAVIECDYAPRAIASTAFAVMHPHNGVMSKYLLHYLRSQPFTDYVNSKAVGVAYPAINDANFFQGLIALPPEAEQSRIVARVEELMRLCDALEAKCQLEATQHAQLLSTLLGTLTASATPEELANHWQRVAQHFDLLLDRPQAIDALEQTLLQLAVRGLLVPQDPADEPASVLLQKIRAEKDRLIAEGKIKKDKPLPPVTDEEKPFELPMGWEWVRFGEYFFELCTGPFGSVIHKEDYVEGGVPLINPSHMIGGRISHDPSVSVSLEMSIQLRAYRLSPGDVVLARRGEVGRYALVTEAQDGWLCGTGSFFVKLHDSCNREFFGLVLEDPDLRRHLQGESVGSTMVNLNQRILVETSMALPPLPEQSRIVTRITQLRRLCFELRQRLAEREAVQARLAEALVQQVA